MMDVIDAVNDLRRVTHTDLAARVKNVAVILTSPRSGSSLLKSVLSSHPEIASLDGEMEPFLALTRNGFSFNAGSDALKSIDNQDVLLDNIFDDMTLPAGGESDYLFLKDRWRKRLLLQFPALFSEDRAHEQLIHDLDAVFRLAAEKKIQSEVMLQDLVLSRVFKSETWRLDYYDGKKNPAASHSFNEPFKLEEPPFVVPRQHRRQLEPDDVEQKILLFKTPPDVYRIGMYEQLFPNARIRYLHLTRGYAQSVNGLMDGWLSPVAFFSHDLERIGLDLSIKGYSDTVSFGKRWWKFDLPPNWQEYLNTSLEEVCLNQWLSAHQAIIDSRVSSLSVSFEEFLSDPAGIIQKITSYLDLPEMLSLPVFPVTMATEAPKFRRWHKRETDLLRMGKRQDVQMMMDSLAYSMNPETWL
ncbi:hypothetical protein UNDYM_2633 [Undibacterium sp. YM2]|nr:hypothetical protein UNDYM_2633 [Undibacterium sp. YM2]